MILKPVQFLYEFGSNIKNKLYDSQYLKSVKLNVPVVSIGNLSVGGTGKTPCVQMLVQEFSKLNRFHKIVIVSRSYKASLKKAEKVDLAKEDAVQIYGDEPCLLQSILPNCHVWSGPNKTETALAAVAAENPDLILVDDGFSHRKLQRNFDLVLIDATAPLSYFQSLPVGRLREPMSQLIRAKAVLLTRTNLVDEQKVDKLIELILKSNSQLKNKIYLSQSITEVSANTNLFVFCGLGNPHSFKRSLELLNFKVEVFKEFPDHHMYSEKDLDLLLQEFKTKPGLTLVTTEKDLIKIKNHPIRDLITVAKNKIELDEKKKGELIETISQYL